ncbi:hypothetical protein [Profundibacter sp.]
MIRAIQIAGPPIGQEKPVRVAQYIRFFLPVHARLPHVGGRE